MMRALAMLLCVMGSAFAAEPTAEPDGPLAITIDGRRATGLMELATRFPGVQPLTGDASAELGAALVQNSVKVRAGQKLRVKVERPGVPRRERDVTASPDLEIYSTLDQVTVSGKGELLVQPAADAPTVLARPGLLQVHFFYFTDPEKRHYEYNEIYLLVESQ